MDVAHCRINLYYQGVDAANAFTQECETATRREFKRRHR